MGIVIWTLAMTTVVGVALWLDGRSDRIDEHARRARHERLMKEVRRHQ